MGSYARDFYAPKATQQPTIGDTKFSVVRQDHMGWMNCDGRYLSPEDYALLFRVVGYSFGQSGDLFQLPDMRSRVPGAISQGTDLSFRTLGDSVGEENHLLTIPEMPTHNHGTDVSPSTSNVGNNLTGVAGDHFHTGTTDLSGEHVHNYLGVQSQGVAAGLDSAADNANRPTETTSPAGVHAHTFTTSNAGNHQHSIASQGGSQVHNNMQPTLFIGNMFMYSGKIHTAGSKWRYENNTDIL